MQLVVSWSAADPDAPAPACDPYWDYTPLLLHMDGTNGSTAAPTNSSASGILIARDGGNLSSTQARFGTTSYWFDGSGTNSAGTRIISTPDLQMVFGAGDFTIEFSMFVVSAPSASALLVDGRAALTQGAYPTLYLSPSRTLGYYVSSADRITSASALSLSTWYHVAIVRSAGVTKLYVNGTQYGSSWTDSTNYIADGLVFGASSYHTSPNTQYGLYGYMDEVRVTRGIARYTATFTPPTEAFAATQCAYDPYWSYVSLLIHADGTDGSTTITNSASTGHSVFAEGNAQIDTAQSKFGGSSIYFDGSGDYIQLSDHPNWDCSAIDYTMECWVRLTGTQFSTASMLFDQIVVGSNPTSSYGLYLGGPNTTSRNAIGFMYYYGSTLGYFEATGLTIPFDTWHHVAASKSGSTVRLFLNGTLVGTHTLLGTINNGTTSLTLGGRNDASLQYYLTGWMDEIRITSGIARYTAAFTPPTAAFPNTGA